MHCFLNLKVKQGQNKRFDAFLASECNEVFSGYQAGEVVQFRRDQCFEDHLCPRPWSQK
jgi:hypothetical protein